MNLGAFARNYFECPMHSDNWDNLGYAISKTFYCQLNIDRNLWIKRLSVSDRGKRLSLRLFCIGDSVRSVMEFKEMHIRHCLLYYFRTGKSAIEIEAILCGVEALVLANYWQFCFNHFRNGNFHLNDKRHPQRLQEAKDDDDDELQAFLP